MGGGVWVGARRVRERGYRRASMGLRCYIESGEIGPVVFDHVVPHSWRFRFGVAPGGRTWYQ